MGYSCFGDSLGEQYHRSGTQFDYLSLMQASGVIMPFYDPDAHLLFLSGKGDGNIRVYEVDHNKLYPTANTQYSSTVSAKVCDGKQE